MITRQLKPVYLPQKLRHETSKYNKIGGWESKDDIVQEFKDKARSLFLANQHERCVYCGMKFIGIPELEHIAPKYKYPQHTFDIKNLALACHRCNCPPNKGKKNVVASSTGNYRDWKFKMLHPYFDNPSDYIFVDAECIIQIRNNLTPDDFERARYTRDDVLNLNETAMVEYREKEMVFQNTDDKTRAIILSISCYQEK